MRRPVVKGMRLAGWIAACLLFSGQALAATNCQGRVSGAAIDVGGNVFANWSFGWVSICSLATTVTPTGGTPIGSSTCQGLYASLLRAKSEGTTVSAYLSSASDCSSLASANFGWPSNPISSYTFF